MLKALVLVLLATRFSQYKITTETETEIEIFTGDESKEFNSALITIEDGKLFFQCACSTWEKVSQRYWFSEYDYDCPASEAGIKAMYADWDAELSEQQAEDAAMEAWEKERVSKLTPEQIEEERKATVKAWEWRHLS